MQETPNVAVRPGKKQEAKTAYFKTLIVSPVMFLRFSPFRDNFNGSMITTETEKAG